MLRVLINYLLAEKILTVFDRIFLIILIFWCSNYISSGQETLKGKIVDASTREPLPFVSIQYQIQPPRGTTSDINGNFVIPYNKNIKVLSTFYLGYAARNISVDSIPSDLHNILIELTPVTFALGEIVIVPGQNPAHRIIKKVIENKSVNNPEKLSSYSCTIYNKFLVEPRIMQNATAKDSISFKNRIQELNGSANLIIESVSKRVYLKPDRIVDTIVASRVSGFKNPSFTFMGTWLQPFDFYNDIVPLASVNYLNPVSQNSYKNYSFHMKDTIINEADTTFIISFEPFPKKNFEGLKGVLYINTRNFGIQNVIAEPFNKGLIDFTIQQKYQLINKEQWFPEQLLFEARLVNQPFDYSGNSYISNVKINPEINPSDLGIEAIHVDKFAGKRDSIYWEHVRTVPLTVQEQLTYLRIDSLGLKSDYDSKLKLVEDLAFGEVPVGAVLGNSPFSIFNILLNKIYYRNVAEGLRLGLGLKTNNRLSEFFSVGGYFGYGFHDHLWKFGTDLNLTLSSENETHFILSYQNTTMEPGASEFENYVVDAPGNFWRNYAVTLNDKVLEYKTGLSSRLFKYAIVSLSFRHQERFPLYDYSFQSEQPEQIQLVSSFDLFIKYSYGEKLGPLFSRRISYGTKYPVIYLIYSKGINGLLKGGISYDRVECGIYKSFTIRKIGESRVRIEAGYVDSDVPYFLLFSAEGNKGSSGVFSLKNTFQTMHRHEFLSDEYINLFYSHNFGSVLFRRKRFNPQLSVYQNIGYGNLHHPEYHNMIEVKTKEKGFYESGLGISNLIKFDIKKTVYFGFGAEIYYRLGAYTYPKVIDNAALKLTFTGSFN
jgi:hypothetical protein